MLMESDRAKLFVGGISRDTSEETLRVHFAEYGNVVQSVVVLDRTKNIPRGFGFVTFSDVDSADKALQEKHVIVGRTVEVKRAIPRHDPNHKHSPNGDLQPNGMLCRDGSQGSSNNQFSSTKKIFIGGLPPSLTDEEFRNYFEKFGSITDAVVMHDSTTLRPRGFGFITFESEDSVNTVLQTSFHELNGKPVEVKRAVPKEKDNYHNNNNYGYNTRTGSSSSSSSKGSPCNGYYQHEAYPPYNHSLYPGYAPVPGYTAVGSHVYGQSASNGAQFIWNFGGMGYGMPVVSPTTSPWYGPGIVDAAKVYPWPHGSTAIHPIYVSNEVGVSGATVGGYNGFTGQGVDGKLNQVAGGYNGFTGHGVNGKLNQVGSTNDPEVSADAKSPKANGGRTKVDFSSLKEGNGTVHKVQADGQDNPCPSGKSC